MHKQAEAARKRLVDALRHELERLRRERESAPPPAALLGAGAIFRESSCASAGGGGGGALGGDLPAELQRLVAEDRQLQVGLVPDLLTLEPSIYSHTYHSLQQSWIM